MKELQALKPTFTDPRIAAMCLMDHCIANITRKGGFYTLRTVIAAAEQKVAMKQALITTILSPLGLKDPAIVICSYTLPPREDFERLSELRASVHTGNYLRNVMVYAHLLAKTIDGQDLLGYDKLSFLPCPDPLYRFVYCMERMVYYGIEITPAIVVHCSQTLAAIASHPGRSLYTMGDDVKIGKKVDRSYFNCIPGNRVEGRIPVLVTCPYCLDAPIKYSYYKEGHQKTKKHLANKEVAAKMDNYYRYLLERFLYSGYGVSMAE